MAIEEAQRGYESGAGGPFGAIVVKDGALLAKAHNTVLQARDATRHAEVNAIRLACQAVGRPHLEGALIYATTEPCPMCFAAIHWARIDTIVSGSYIADVKALGFNELSLSNRKMKELGGATVSLVEGVLIDEARALLQRWDRSDQKKLY